MLVQEYGNESMSRKCGYEWFKRFREGKEATEDKPCSGRPYTSRTPEIIQKVQQMLVQDRRLTLKLFVEELSISKDTAQTIFRDDLDKRIICSRFVPHVLIDEQKANRMETSGDFISMCDQNPLLHERWDLVLPLRSEIKTAIDVVVFTDFPATNKESSENI